MLHSDAVIFCQRFHRFLRGRDSMKPGRKKITASFLLPEAGAGYSPPLCSAISWWNSGVARSEANSLSFINCLRSRKPASSALRR